MGEYNKNAWGLGNASESKLDAPRGDWGSVLSQRKIEKIDPVKDLGDFAAKSDAAVKDANLQERKTWGKQREEGLKFTDPVKNEAPLLPAGNPKGKINKTDVAIAEPVALHDWQITTAEGGWAVSAGYVYYVNETTSAVIASTTVLGEAGVIYLHITRDPSSRAVASATIELLEGYTASTESDQYFELGTVGGAPTIIQKQFTPIRVYEDLFVINGEFKLGSIAMLADNLYTPPA